MKERMVGVREKRRQAWEEGEKNEGMEGKDGEEKGRRTKVWKE